jgi:hypothetical protein
MPRSAKAYSMPNGPAKHEWFFADIKLLPEDETRAAYYWEFGIETPDVIKEVEELRKRRDQDRLFDSKMLQEWCATNPKSENDPAKCIARVNRLRERFPGLRCTSFHDSDIHFLSDWPEFPSQHWLQIPERPQKRKARLLFPQPGSVSFFDGLRWDESQVFDTAVGTFYTNGSDLFWRDSTPDIDRLLGGIRLSAKYLPTDKTPWGASSEDRWTEYRVVKLNWARSDRKLKADFAAWLKENRPDDRQPYHKSKNSDSRRTTERDLLKALGAYRLLRHFNADWNAAANFSAQFCTDKRGNPKPLYVEQCEWHDAENKAAKALTDFHIHVFTSKVFG